MLYIQYNLKSLHNAAFRFRWRAG